jgi:tetratricopeptide (TPR) repeat protein
MDQLAATNEGTVMSPARELDAWGLALTTCSRAAARAYDSALMSLLSHRTDTVQHVDAALQHDPEFALAFVVRGFALRLLARADVLPQVLAALESAECALERCGGGTERERLLCRALRAFWEHDSAQAVQLLALSVRTQPRCLLSMKLHHALCFMNGRIEDMRRATEHSLAVLDASLPGHSFLVGCHAFALEESHLFDAAERLSRGALAVHPNDPWTYHVLVHVWTMQDRTREGLRAMRERAGRFPGANNFAAHLAWHHALFALAEGELDEALSLYDSEIVRALGRDYRDLANCASLLFRLERAGCEVGVRWHAIADWSAAREGDHLLAFADLHQVLALLGAGRVEAARSYVQAMRTAVLQRLDGAALVTRSIGLPAAEGMLALFAGDGHAALRRLAPLAGGSAPLGGSEAQRELFEMFAIEAALLAGQDEVARALLTEQLGRRPQCRWAARYGVQLEAGRANLSAVPSL